MLNLHETEKFPISISEKLMAQAILTDLYYFLENGYSKAQIKLVLEHLINNIEI